MCNLSIASASRNLVSLSFPLLIASASLFSGSFVPPPTHLVRLVIIFFSAPKLRPHHRETSCLPAPPRNRRWTTTRKAIGTRKACHEQPALLITAVASFHLSLVDLARLSRTGASASPPSGCAAAPRQRCLQHAAGTDRTDSSHGQCRAPYERLDRDAAVFEERHVDCSQLATHVSAYKTSFHCCGGFSIYPGDFVSPLFWARRVFFLHHKIRLNP